MDKLLFDTNYLLDLALEHRPDADAAAELFDLVCRGCSIGVVSPTSLKDFYYMTRHDMSEEKRREWIKLFVDAFIVGDIGRSTCIHALEDGEPDFEDGLVRAVAEAERCTYLVSRDGTAFNTSGILRLSPRDTLERLCR